MSLTLSEAHKILEAEGLAFVDFVDILPPLIGVPI